MKRILLICIWILPFLWSCSSDDSEEKVIVQMPIHLYISTDGVWQAHRAPGDPGVPQNYQLPRYLYAYFVQKLDGGGYNMDIMEEDLDPKKWKEVANPNSPGLYVYEGNLSMLLSKDNILATNTAGPETGESRVYAITSYDPLVFDQPTGKDGYQKLPDLQLDMSIEANKGVDLMNVYANPLGGVRSNGAVAKKGDFLYETEVTCYHVAARIDIQWDINPALQGTFKLKTIELQNLPQQGYFFKHTANPVGVGTQTFTADVGNQWYGRQVFHTFDRKKVECKYTLAHTGNIDKVVNQTYEAPSAGNGVLSDVYSSWYRINATFGY